MTKYKVSDKVNWDGKSETDNLEKASIAIIVTVDDNPLTLLPYFLDNGYWVSEKNLTAIK